MNFHLRAGTQRVTWIIALVSRLVTQISFCVSLHILVNYSTDFHWAMQKWPQLIFYLATIFSAIHFALDDVDCAPVSGTSFTYNLMVMSISSFTEITWSNVILDFFCTFLDLLWYWNLYDLQCFIWNFMFPIRRTMV